MFTGGGIIVVSRFCQSQIQRISIGSIRESDTLRSTVSKVSLSQIIARIVRKNKLNSEVVQFGVAWKLDGGKRSYLTGCKTDSTVVIRRILVNDSIIIRIKENK